MFELVCEKKQGVGVANEWTRGGKATLSVSPRHLGGGLFHNEPNHSTGIIPGNDGERNWG